MRPPTTNHGFSRTHSLMQARRLHSRAARRSNNQNIHHPNGEDAPSVRQLDLAPFDRLIWPHPVGESSPSLEPPSGLVGTVESALCFPSRCGNPRGERISISGVSFHRPPFLSFLLLFSFFVPLPSFPQKNIEPGSPRNDDRPLGRPTTSPVLSLPSSLATFFPFQRSAETVRLRARLDDVRLVGQSVQHRLTQSCVRKHCGPLGER